MVRRKRTKTVDRALAMKYHGVGRGFLSAAADLSAVASDDDAYGNAIALLAIHGAIAMADALAIAYGERKSAEGDHGHAVGLLVFEGEADAFLRGHLHLGLLCAGAWSFQRPRL